MAKEIYERLCTKFEEQVALDQVYDLREVQRMVEKWRDRPEDLKLADGLFDWHKMKDYELPGKPASISWTCGSGIKRN